MFNESKVKFKIVFCCSVAVKTLLLHYLFLIFLRIEFVDEYLYSFVLKNLGKLVHVFDDANKLISFLFYNYFFDISTRFSYVSCLFFTGQ